MLSTQLRQRARLNGVARLLDWRGTLNAVYLPRQRRQSTNAALEQNWVTIGEYFEAVLERKVPPPEHAR